MQCVKILNMMMINDDHHIITIKPREGKMKRYNPDTKKMEFSPIFIDGDFALDEDGVWHMISESSDAGIAYIEIDGQTYIVV